MSDETVTDDFAEVERSLQLQRRLRTQKIKQLNHYHHLHKLILMINSSSGQVSGIMGREIVCVALQEISPPGL